MAGAGNPAQAQTPNVYQQSSGALTSAIGNTMGAMAGPNIGAFANPYQGQVINAAMGDINRQQQQSLNQLGASATRAGAFGGSRHGVAEAQTLGEFGRQAGDYATQMRQQGFNTALGAAQQQQNTQLAGAGQLGSLANLGFGFGQQLNQNQMQQGAMQQALNQALIDAGRNQYAGFTGSPNQSLAGPLAALNASNMGQNTQTQTQTPGLFNIFSAILGM